MTTTKISKEEVSNLKAEIESYKNKNRLLELEKERILIREDEKKEPFTILKKYKRDIKNRK